MRPLLVAAVVLVLAGCGAEKLNADERYRLGSVELDISGTVAYGDGYGKTLRGVDYLIALCRAKAGAKYDERTVKQVLEDDANELRGYQPDLAAKLDRVLDDGCK